MMKNRREHRRGYSLIELMAGMLAAAVLALTVGTMLYHAYDAWDDNHDAVNLHRDGRNAMDLMARAIRDASAARVTTAANNNLVILNEAGASSVRFWRTSGRLLYSPDTGGGVDDIILVGYERGADRARATRFNVTLTATDVTIRLDLERGDEAIRFDSTVAFRN